MYLFRNSTEFSCFGAEISLMLKFHAYSKYVSAYYLYHYRTVLTFRVSTGGMVTQVLIYENKYLSINEKHLIVSKAVSEG